MFETSGGDARALERPPSRIAEQVGLWIRNARWLGSQLARHPSAMVGAVVVVAFMVVAACAPYVAPCDPTLPDLAARLKPPAWMDGSIQGRFLGTDRLGRDIFSRIIYGARVSICVGLLSVSVSVAVGSSLGIVAAYYGGRVDDVLCRFSDLLMAFPFLIFTIFAMAVLGPGFWNLVVALTFKGWVEFFRLVRGETLSEKSKEYVEAARALGRSNGAIMASEILPNVVHSIIVLGTLRMGYFIITEATLSFLGIGIPPEIPAWGSMVAGGRSHMMTAWWISTMPGLALVALVLAINLLGEGLRDILDPRLKLQE